MQELRSYSAINDAMIATKRDIEPVSYHDLIVGVDNGLLHYAANRKDSGLGRINDGLKTVDAGSTKI